MRIVVRSKERCFDCGILFTEGNMFQCKTHQRKAERMFLDISGTGNRYKLYTDVDGNPLHRLNIFSLKDRIAKEVVKKTFNIKRYLPRNKMKYLFANYKLQFLEKMRIRTEFPHEHTDWLSKSGYKEIKSAVLKHFDYFDEMDIAEIRTSIIRDWQSEELGTKGTKKKISGVLKQLLRWAHAQEDLASVPAFPAIRAVYKKKKGISQDIQAAILSHLPSSYQPILLWATETGRRINEYRATRIRDIDFRRGVYRIGGAFDIDESYKPFPKVPDHVESEFPLTKELIEILAMVGITKETILSRDPDDWVFVNQEAKDHGHYRYRTIKKRFDLASRSAGYPQVELNVFARHSMAYQLINAGVSMERVANVLNNSRDVAAKNYAHIEACNMAEVIKLRSGDSRGQFSEGVSLKISKA